ncbi:MAG TPA: DUF3857 and transglutaminase domain-containing protein [Acidobacteriaceae bacterium]
MTSLPGYPGAAAVVLFREQITNDDSHATYFHERVKILTEDGKKYANVELPYTKSSGEWGWIGNDRDISEISGRTIHPDGTIVPFSGKPYVKTLETETLDHGTAKRQAAVFTLPDVTVGSIIEYRYASRINEYFYNVPDWIIQGNLYVKSAHYEWSTNGNWPITWFPILPPGAHIEHHQFGSNAIGLRHTFELSINDVPPQVEEEFMPPIANYSYRVLFYFVRANSADDFWKVAGKDWFHDANSFSNPNSDLTTATQQIIAGATTGDEKLRKIYAAVEQLENTDYTREHERREDKANGLAKLNHSSDVLKNKRGSSTELTELFVGMARAAGIKAELMLVPNRSEGFFIPSFLSLGQFSDVIAVVNVDGKDQFLDPGSRFCPYGKLAWQHTFVQGLREKDKEVVFDKTPLPAFSDNQTVRVANLSMDSTGHISGTVDLAFIGSPAVEWRQEALTGDEDSLKHNLRSTLEEMIPKSLEITGLTISALEDYEHPLKVTYNVSGSFGAWTGKRLLLPADLFLSGSHASFPEEKRDLAVYFHYPKQVLDALRITFPSNLTLEAAPSATKLGLPGKGLYALSVESNPTSFTTKRTFVFNDILVLPTSYTQLRSFYSELEANDQQSIILKSPIAPAPASADGGN